jgi:hypothetical protein
MWGNAKALILFAAFAAYGAHEDPLAKQEAFLGPIDRVSTVTIELSMIEPDRTYDLLIRMRRPDRYRIDLRRWGFSVYTEAVGRRGPWQQSLLQWSPVQPSKEGARALVSGLEWMTWGRSLLELKGRGHEVRVLPGTSDAEVELDATLANGQSRRYFLDRETGRVLRTRQHVALHPDQAGGRTERWLEAHYEDYRRVGALTVPFLIRVFEPGAASPAQTLVVHAIRLDEPVADMLFEAR